MRGWRAALVLVCCMAPPDGARAQQQQPVESNEEGRLLREASSLEWSGRHAEAIEVLDGLLTRAPTSSGGLFALERILRSVGRVADVLPYADRYLAADPTASGPRYMKLRVLVEVDSLVALDAAAAEWVRAVPGSPDPYREESRLVERAFGDARAIEVLREGRSALGEEDALALELGDLLAATGDAEGAVGEWALALRSPDADLEGLRRRWEGLTSEAPQLSRPIVEALLAAPSNRERRRAAVRLALQAGPEVEAQRVAERAMEGLRQSELPTFLDEVARRATATPAPSVALWALTEWSELDDRGEPPSLDARIAAAALAAADTAAALQAYRRLARALPAGSPERGRVIADIIRVEATRESAETLAVRLEGFRAEFPDAVALDDLTAAAAAGLAARGLSADALSLADRLGGPRSQLERAWLLFADGDHDAGELALEASLPALAPTQATRVIQLLSRLDRLGPEAGGALAAAAAAVHHGREEEAIAHLEGTVADIPARERAPLHHEASRVALALGDTARAQGHLRRIADSYVSSPEAPEALLQLARIMSASPEGVDEARTILRALIVDRPQSAVVPAARRELERLGRGS